MSTPTYLSNLVLCVVDGTPIPIESGNVSQGITLAMESASNSVFSTANYVQQKQPTAQITTKAIDLALAKIGFNALSLDSTTTVDFYFAEKSIPTSGIKFYDSTGAIKVSFNSGIAYFDSLDCPETGSASATFQILGAGSSDSVGFTITSNQSVPDSTTGCLSYVFVTGPLSDSSGAQSPVSSWSYTSGITPEYAYINGLPQPRGVGISAYQPKFTINTNDKSLVTDFISSNEIIGCLSDVSLFLRKTDLCSSRVPETTAEHIEFSIINSTIQASNMSGGNNTSAQYSFELDPLLDCGTSTAPITIDLSAAISS